MQRGIPLYVCVAIHKCCVPCAMGGQFCFFGNEAETRLLLQPWPTQHTRLHTATSPHRADQHHFVKELCIKNKKQKSPTKITWTINKAANERVHQLLEN